MHTPAPPVNPFDHEAGALLTAISPARLSTYLARTHMDLRRAIDLYAWNIRAAAALYPLLQVNEVALRNAVDRGLVSQYGQGWPASGAFLRSLPDRSRQPYQASLGRLRKELGPSRVSTGDVVAAQSYGFWVVLLTARFDARIWSREFARTFPHAPPPVDRAAVHSAADSIRRLRNRIAHHEPLLAHDLRGAHRRASSMVAWISPEKAAWARAHWPPDERLLRPP